ncbi:MAG: 2-C-methyl-D-erythritol 2,4-cyclodiphosphate synthase [Mucinivorans sp.]
MLRIGNGYDVHKLEKNIPLVIGGVHINHPLGLAAHSDGDVLLHALCDALLGAAALNDIGTHFSDQDQTYKGIDSRILVRQVCQMINTNYTIQNVDCTIIAQAPKLAPYIQQMRATIAQDLQIDISQVGVKATTTEHLGFQGRGEGISALCSALIAQK